MRGRFVVFLVIVSIALACEDPNTLAVSRVFSGNNLQTIYSDTFSVFTSTVQLDSFISSGTGTILLGRYRDDRLGLVSASSYFQICYSGSFTQAYTSVFDSAVVVFPYNHLVTGDTTKLMTIKGYEVKETLQLRTPPIGSGIKLSYLNSGYGLYSNSTFAYSADPIFSGTVKLFPHTDTLSIRVPDSFGRKWFLMAKHDSANHYFDNPTRFVNSFFQGLYVEADASTEACVAGFVVNDNSNNSSSSSNKKTRNFKLRFYYKVLSNGFLRQTHQDFVVYNPILQYNNIQYDRSGTKLSSLQPNGGISSRLTDEASYVQAGTGLATKLDFPSVKAFFYNNPAVTLNAAYLYVYPEAGSYPRNTLPPKTLQLYTTDASNIPLVPLPSGGSSTITYDLQYGLNTQYTFDLFTYLYGQTKASQNLVTPLLLTAGGSLGTNAQRLYLGDRVHPNTKIQLKLFYSNAQK
jgi:hypothetical protein